MDFKTRKISRNKSDNNPIKSRFKHSLPPKKRINGKVKVHLFTIFGSVAIIFILLFGIVQAIKSIDLSAIVFSFGKTLMTDENGNTNILLVGIGGEGHDGSNLTDTIIVASINYKEKVVPMLSIPRDFYIEDEQTRINTIYEIYHDESTEEGMNALSNTITDITGLEIQYFVKVDFKGFEQIVDSLGGVELMVENTIDDPYYPKDGTIYFEPFYLEEGYQTLDGETALKYARSRKTTSDFDRARRQQNLLNAIKEKALSLNILTNPNKITKLYNSVGDSIETNLSLAEIIEGAKLASDYNKDNLYPIVFNDDPTECGGLLYTPVREYFSGAAVLLPAGNDYDYTNYFVDTVFGNMDAILAQDKIQILNGTKIPGLAYEGLELLSRHCLNVVYYGNAIERPLETSTIYYKTDEEGNPPKALEYVKSLTKIPTQAGIPDYYLETERRSDSQIVVEMGVDYLEFRPDDPYDSLRYVTPISRPSQDTASDSENDSETDADASTNDTTPPSDTTDNSPPITTEE